jgi:hypothetical protein
MLQIIFTLYGIQLLFQLDRREIVSESKVGKFLISNHHYCLFVAELWGLTAKGLFGKKMIERWNILNPIETSEYQEKNVWEVCF